MSDLSQSSQKSIRIVLAGRAPVSIEPALWPVIASAEDTWFDGQYDFQSNRTSDWRLIVRRHERGCVLVYGLYSYESRYQGAATYNIRGGRKLAPGADLPAAIQSVAAWMEAAVADARPDDARRFRRLANECIGDLPAEECGCDGGPEVARTI